MSAPQAAENTNAEEQTALEMVCADLQQFMKDEILKIKDKLKAEDEKKYMGEILVSADKKITVKVTFNNENQEMCDDLSKGRDYFTKTKKSILGGPIFSSGQFYFEVDVKGKKFWGVGVAEDYAEKTGEIEVNPENGFWMISKRKTYQIKVYKDKAKAKDKDKDEDKDKPKDKANRGSLDQTQLDKVGVFVDFKKGLVEFYNADTSALIYPFRAKLVKKLRPVILEIPNDG